MITWPASATNYIVLWSTNPEGPWTPCLTPIAYGPGYCAMAVQCTGECKYFRLAQGVRFADDFEDGLDPRWTDRYAGPEFQAKVNLQDLNGQLRISCTNLGTDWPAVVLSPEDLVLADFAVSIDIVGWETNSVDRLIVAMHGRFDPDTLYDPGADYAMYAAGLTLFDKLNYPGQSLLWYVIYGVGTMQQSPPLEPLHSSKDYRLVFYGVGPSLTLQLFELDDEGKPHFVKELQWTDPLSRFTEGVVGFHVYGAKDGTGTVDITLDNFDAVGTTPSTP